MGTREYYVRKGTQTDLLHLLVLNTVFNLARQRIVFVFGWGERMLLVLPKCVHLLTPRQVTRNSQKCNH